MCVSVCDTRDELRGIERDLGKRSAAVIILNCIISDSSLHCESCFQNSGILGAGAKCQVYGHSTVRQIHV